MALTERHEKIRQAVMRYRELLDVLADRHAANERAYAALFSGIAPETLARLPEKDTQGEAARLLIENGLDPIQRGVLQMYYDLRDLERAFDDLYGNLAAAPPDED